MPRAPAPVGNRHERAQAALLERCSAYRAVAPTAFHFSHLTAARLYGLPVPSRLLELTAIDVSVPQTAVQPRGAGVIGHRVPPVPIRVVNDLPVPAPETVWVQLGGLLSIDELVVIGDHLVRRKRPLCSMDALASAISGLSRVRGVRSLRAAVADVRSGTDSPPETVTRLTLIRAGLPEPTVRYSVIDDDGYFVGTPDLAYPRERIAIEYEGEGHWGDRRVFEDDILRRELFEEAGWRVIRVTAAHLRDPLRLVNRVARALAGSPNR
jgi:hypothetical protein